MKTVILNLSLLFVFGIASHQAYAQNVQDTTMIVNGVCGMCERTIETAATSLEGVSLASWNKDTKVLQLAYNPDLVELSQINDAINNSGYDTEYNTAPEEAYQALHKCCHYRDPKVVGEHQSK